MIDRNHSSDSHDRGMTRPRWAFGDMWVAWRAMKHLKICNFKQSNVYRFKQLQELGYNCERSLLRAKLRQGDRMGADRFNLGHRGVNPIRTLHASFP